MGFLSRQRRRWSDKLLRLLPVSEPSLLRLLVGRSRGRLASSGITPKLDPRRLRLIFRVRERRDEELWHRLGPLASPRLFSWLSPRLVL